MELTEGRKPPHVLVLLYYFPPLGTAGASIRTVNFIKYLSREGWRFTVIAADPRGAVTAVRDDTSRFLLDEIPPDTTIVRVKSPIRFPSLSRRTFDGPTDAGDPGTTTAVARLAVNVRRLIRKLGSHLHWQWWLIPDPISLWIGAANAAAVQATRSSPIDVIYAACPPYSVLLLGERLKRKLRKPLVLDIKDDWVGTPAHLAKPRILQVADRYLERKVIRAADQVVSVTEPSQGNFLSRFPDQAAKFQFVPNGCDVEGFEDVLADRVRKTNDQFTIVAAGGYQRSIRSPEAFFRAVGRLAMRRTDVAKRIRIELIGDTLLQDFSPEELRDLGVRDLLRQRAPLPKREFVTALNQADLLLCLLYHGWQMMVPGKLYEYWAAGWAPILMIDDGGAAREILNRHHLGAAVDRDDVAGIERVIERYFDAWAHGNPEHISTSGLESYDRRHLAHQMGQVLLGAQKAEERSS